MYPSSFYALVNEIQFLELGMFTNKYSVIPDPKQKLV